VDAPYAVVGEGYPIAVPGRRGPPRSRWSSKGMPRRRAAEKRFLIAVQGEKVWGALEYRVAERSLFLGSLTEPWPRNGCCRRGHSTLKLASWRGRQAYGKSGQPPTRGTTTHTKLDTNGRVASGEWILRSRWCSAASFRKEAGAGCSPYGAA
jgi:hypothetical protein